MLNCAAMTRLRPVRSTGARVLRAVVIVAVLVLLLPYALVLVYRFVDPASVPMAWRWINGMRVHRTWVPLDRMAPTLPLAVLASEDARFCRHFGIDLRELKNAIEGADDITGMRGGSTITQQTAKNLFLWQGRSIVRKVIEAPLAIWIDLVLPKRRVLEIYLNIAQWGPTGQFGVEAGARRAFDKSVRGLDEEEAALLAAVLPSPVRRNARQPGPGMRRVAARIQAKAASFPDIDACVRSSRP